MITHFSASFNEKMRVTLKNEVEWDIRKMLKAYLKSLLAVSGNLVGMQIVHFKLKYIIDYD